VGCGSGVFLNQTAALANHVYGCDISFDLLQLCQQYVQENNVGNVSLFLADAEGLPFENDSFDVVYMVDVLHHLYRVESSVDEVARVLKPSGKLLVHEPNKYNVLLALLCLIDRNEWGALRLGSKVTYRKLFDEKFSFELLDYNGLLIGPDSKCNLSIADFLLESSFSPLLEWLSPKVFMVLKLKNSM
jgi:ubiquinone/menaquinone biosynthesis C-methylase UbiE